MHGAFHISHRHILNYRYLFHHPQYFEFKYDLEHYLINKTKRKPEQHYHPLYVQANVTSHENISSVKIYIFVLFLFLKFFEK